MALPYEIYYWPTVPGRGEFIRLLLEEVGAPYTNVPQAEGGMQKLLARLGGQEVPEEDGNDGSDTAAALSPPVLAPPFLKQGGLVLSQTANILLFLGRRHGLAGDASSGDDADAAYKISGLAMTALDGLCGEVHDSHHPISAGLYWEDQVAESTRRTEDYVKTRLPKFLAYFEAVLASKASKGGRWLYNGKLSYADLVLFQCIDGVKHSFPKAMAKYEEQYTKVFALHAAVKERPNIKAYLASPRRQAYGDGIWRYNKALDIEA